MAEYSLMVKYSSELIINGSVNVPYLLLRFYKRMNLSEIELVLILHLWRFREEEKDEFPDLEKIAEFMTTTSVEIQALIAGLIEKKILQVEHLFDKKQGSWVDRISYSGLFDQLMEYWAIEKSKQAETQEEDELHLSEEIIHELFKTFEKEFGRLLSPFESNQIIEWCQKDYFSPELILEALRRTSLRGIRNLKYVDSILLDWKTNNLNSLEEIESHEKQYQASQQTKENRPKKQASKEKEDYKKKIEKYKDVYMN